MSWEDVLKGRYYTDRGAKRHKKELKREARKKRKEDRTVSSKITAGQKEMEKIENRKIRIGEWSWSLEAS